jgi:hypothetical protein
MFPLSFRLVLASHYTITFALIVQSYSSIFLVPTCFNQKFPLSRYYSFLLPLFFKLLLYRCPLHTPSEYMFKGHRSLIWLFHFNRAGFSDLNLWVLVVVSYRDVQRSFLCLSRISEIQSDDGDKNYSVCDYYMFNDIRVDISITQGRTPFKSVTWVPFETVSVISYVHLRPFHGYSSHSFSIPSQGGPSRHASSIPSPDQRELLPDLNLTPPPSPVADPGPT